MEVVQTPLKGKGTGNINQRIYFADCQLEELHVLKFDGPQGQPVDAEFGLLVRGAVKQGRQGWVKG